MEIGPQQIGKVLITAGIVLIVAGGLFLALGKLGLFRLPGDLEFGGKNWRVYAPLGTCVLLSILLTLAMWLIQYFKR